MTDLIRWEPYGMKTLRNTIDSLFDELFKLPEYFPAFPLSLSGYQVPVDVIETDKEFVIKANVPGIKKEDLEVEVSENAVTIRGKFSEETETGGRGYRVKERHSGAFSRVIRVDDSVLTEKAQARYNNGVLELILPKAQPSIPKVKRLEIQG